RTMTSVNDILRHTRYLDLLWHLDSYRHEEADAHGESGRQRFEREFKEWFPDDEIHADVDSMIDCIIDPMEIYVSCTTESGKLGRRRLSRKSECIELAKAHMDRAEQVARNRFRTNIGREIWERLDKCLRSRLPTFIEGFEGRGKSENTYSWYCGHRW